MGSSPIPLAESKRRLNGTNTHQQSKHSQDKETTIAGAWIIKARPDDQSSGYETAPDQSGLAALFNPIMKIN